MTILSKLEETGDKWWKESFLQNLAVAGWFVVVSSASRLEESGSMNVWGGAGLLAAFDLLIPITRWWYVAVGRG